MSGPGSYVERKMKEGGAFPPQTSEDLGIGLSPYTGRTMPDFFKELHPTDIRPMGNAFGQQVDNMLGNWKGFENEYRASPRFDPNEVKGQIDDSYFRSIASLPSLKSNLKGMGVGAAEGTLALNSALPVMQARGESYGNLARDKYQADQSWLANLANIIGRGNEMGFQGQNVLMRVAEMIQNMELNG